jgi:hypothetical protein
MRESLKHSFLAVALLSFSFTPGVLAAQEEQPQEELQLEACTATQEPFEIETGQVAVPVTFTLSESIGVVSRLDAPEESGLSIAAVEDLPRTEMANPEEQPEPIVMSVESPNVVTLWLSTANSAAGEHDVVLAGETGTCSARVAVKDPA